jgi:hypothetical protein
MPVLEIKIEDKVCEWAENNGWVAAKLAWIGQTGWPDRTFMKRGFNGKMMVAQIEFKKVGGRRRKKQGYWIGRILDMGGHALFCDDVDVGIYFLKNVEFEYHDE